MAAGMVAPVRSRGARPGMRIVEYTGGSTGSSLAMVCAARGYRAHLVTADCFALEKIQTMRAFGAEVEVLESDGGKVTPELFDRFKARIAELAAEPDTWWAEQFVNPGNTTGYQALAQEIVEELRRHRRLRHGHRHGRLLLRGGRGAEGSRLVRPVRRGRAGDVAQPVRRPTRRASAGGHRRRVRAARRAARPRRRDRRRQRRRAFAAHGRWRGARGSSRGRRPGPTSSPRGGSPRSSGPGRRVVTILVDTGLKYLAGDLFAG